MDFKSNLQKENREKFDESFVEFTADETTWGAGLYINDKISPVDIKSHEDTLISNTVDKTLDLVREWAESRVLTRESKVEFPDGVDVTLTSRESLVKMGAEGMRRDLTNYLNSLK